MKRIWTLILTAAILGLLDLSQAGEAARAPKLLDSFLSGPMAGIDEVVFCARQNGKDPHWYANFGHYGPFPDRKPYGDGGRLYKLNLHTLKTTTLLNDPRGGVRDAQVHYDGRTIVFSYRTGGELYYHLYEIDADGRNLKQLTDGEFDDIEPTYMPDGGIVFVSSRCKRFVNCWLTPVATLHRCDREGRNIRAISSNNEHDNTPWVLADGRLLYTRWEYVDRSQVHFHHLWSANPDGTNQTTFFGNMIPGTTMIDAKPVLNSQKIVVSFSPGHGRTEHDGFVTVVDPYAGPDEPSFARQITKSADYRDPWAFSENAFMAAHGTTIVLIDGKGKVEELFKLSADDIQAGLQCHEPRPILAHARERVIPERVDESATTGQLVLGDIYDGRNMTGVERGQIKKLLVLESLPMPVHYTGGMEPISYGGTFTLERIAGTVPVEADGSAYVELPALRSFFFVALDENDLSVKRMQSFLTVQPGEVSSCVGCHEQRTRTPQYMPSSTVQAATRAPSKVEPILDVPDVLDFPRDIQPILDRHCLKCHDYDKRDGDVILSGDHGPMFSHSYFTLTIRNQVADGRNRPKSNYAPRMLGSSASPLMKKLDPSHYGVQVSALERKTIRLWIDSAGAYPGTYAALGTGSIGMHTENKMDRDDLKWPSTLAGAESLKQRCGACHTDQRALPLTVTHDQFRAPWEDLSANDPRRHYSRHLIYNLSRPEKSLLLLAPLSAQSGGYGICNKKSGAAPVFASANDADYLKILAAISEAKKHLDEIKRFDMPDFKPRVDWVREMKQYGVLPRDLPADAPLDVYAVERKYWQSLWYVPIRADEKHKPLSQAGANE
ncbi:MAG TPA: hypothetical protein VKX17_07070 [Planctomycetota bacterium]|nr:hypothetical protein [Planctomycetota bacterium]